MTMKKEGIQTRNRKLSSKSKKKKGSIGGGIGGGIGSGGGIGGGGGGGGACLSLSGMMRGDGTGAGYHHPASAALHPHPAAMSHYHHHAAAAAAAMYHHHHHQATQPAAPSAPIHPHHHHMASLTGLGLPGSSNAMVSTYFSLGAGDLYPLSNPKTSISFSFKITRFSFFRQIPYYNILLIINNNTYITGTDVKNIQGEVFAP